MMIRTIGKDTAPLYKHETGNQVKTHLLWGDRVRVDQVGASRSKVRARGKVGWVANGSLGDKSLLEIYVIDVGQGDGVLIRTPDHRHILIDGGWPRKNLPTAANAADFVDWKFATDYGEEQIRLDAMICTHNDQDHYGGLWDLLDPDERAGLHLTDVRVEAFYHAGLAWWAEQGGKVLGPWQPTAQGDMFTQLMGDRDGVVAAVQAGADPRLAGDWRNFMECVTQARRADGVPTPIRRLSNLSGYLPGFAPAAGLPSIKVLAPVEFEVDGEPAIRRFRADESVNTNGNSVLLRIDYGRARILLTGDLNRDSQESLLADYAGQHDQLTCDVAKACHHGSDKVSLQFLQKVEPSAWVISSGDSEGYDHPRPAIVAASGLTGHRQVVGDELITPLVYCTELARSVGLGTPVSATVRDEEGQTVDACSGLAPKRVMVTYTETKPGDREPTTRTLPLSARQIAARLVFGLVNVRTDGDKVLCATLSEKDATWHTKSFRARF